VVLHVIHDPAEAPGFYAHKGKKKKFLRSMEEAAEEMMEEFLAKMRKDHPDQLPIKKAVSLLVVGTPVTRILEIAEKEQAKMIIIGSHGRTGLSHLLVGSKAERVVQLSPIPVTVVKTPTKK
jgi:nucleotide-binding universal stress UspA family protein